MVDRGTAIAHRATVLQLLIRRRFVSRSNRGGRSEETETNPMTNDSRADFTIDSVAPRIAGHCSGPLTEHHSFRFYASLQSQPLAQKRGRTPLLRGRNYGDRRLLDNQQQQQEQQQQRNTYSAGSSLKPKKECPMAGATSRRRAAATKLCDASPRLSTAFWPKKN